MAALDFGMAMARGMLPTSEKAQKDLLNLAGGRNIFKSEDWWNTQVDKQISEGYREIQRTGKEYLMPSGEYQREKTQTSFQSGRYVGGIAGLPGYFVAGPGYGGIAGLFGPSGRTVTSYTAPEGAVKRGDQFVTRDVPIFGTAREDFTAGELTDIERGAEAGAKRTKAQSEATKASQRRLRRGTGGLVGKAKLPGEAPSTGLPALGTTGLDMTAGLFGADIKL